MVSGRSWVADSSEHSSGLEDRADLRLWGSEITEPAPEERVFLIW